MSSAPILLLIRRQFKSSLGFLMDSSLPFGKSFSHRNFILANSSGVILSAISSKKRLNSAFFWRVVAVDSFMADDHKGINVKRQQLNNNNNNNHSNKSKSNLQCKNSVNLFTRTKNNNSNFDNNNNDDDNSTKMRRNVCMLTEGWQSNKPPLCL